MTEKTPQKNSTPRPPVIVVMGHIDHGKSTLLDYIRKSNVVDGEAGGITQHVSAYEVEHGGRKITFLDTPGHEAFSSMRECGVCSADIAILVVSAEDGVKAQTKEALETIREAHIPFVVAINKIDKPQANIEKTKQDLAENNVFVEGYGGDIPFTAISAKEGTGTDELLDTVILVADLEELSGNPEKPAEGTILETRVNPKKGIAATLIIKDGTLKKGQFVSAGGALAPVRILENFAGTSIDEATFSSPVSIIGWDKAPIVGSMFNTHTSKKDAEHTVSHQAQTKKNEPTNESAGIIIPLIIKSDVAGGLQAIKKEIKKINIEDVAFQVVLEGVGAISENDIKTAQTSSGMRALVVGFHVSVDKQARHLAEQTKVPVQTFSVIYELTEWLDKTARENKPKIETEEIIGAAKILRVFSQNKNKQVLGGRVQSGKMTLGAPIKIMRRDYEIGRGKITELQQAKASVKEVPEGMEFGIMIESKTEVAEGDSIETFIVVQK